MNLDPQVELLREQAMFAQCSVEGPTGARQRAMVYYVRPLIRLVILGAGNDAQFRNFCGVAGRPELATDERFAANDARVRNREVLVPILEEVMKQRRRDEWVAALETAGVPSGPINTIDNPTNPTNLTHEGQGMWALGHS